MGNSHKQPHQLPRYEWTWAGNQNGIDVYRRADGVLGERRKVSLDHHFSIEEEKKIYKMRENNENGFVRVYEVDGGDASSKPKQSSACQCAQSIHLLVYSERILNRLSDLPQMTFEQSVHFLWDTLNAFQKLYEEFGPFHINGELIGLNSDHHIRVWLNENWALNHPSHEISHYKGMNNGDIPPELKNQSQMIHNLIQVIEQKTENGRFPQPFGQQAKQSAGGFKKFKKFLNHYMINDYQKSAPSVINKSKEEKEAVRPVELTYIKQQNATKPVFGQKINNSIILHSGYQDDHHVGTSKPAVTFGNTVKPVEPLYRPFQQINRPVQQTRPVQHLRPVQPARPVEFARPVQYSRPAEYTRPVEHARPVQFNRPTGHAEVTERPWASSMQPQPYLSNGHQIRNDVPVASNVHFSNPQTSVMNHPLSMDVPKKEYPKFKFVNDANSAPVTSVPISHQSQSVPIAPAGGDSGSGSQLRLQEIRSMLKGDIQKMNSHQSQYRIVGDPNSKMA